MAENNPTPQPAAPAAKSRNPVEKLLVRGFIAIMLVLVAIEGISKWQHYTTMTTLLAKIKMVDESSENAAVTEADVKAVIGGKQPSKSGQPEIGYYGASRVDVYSWFTFSPVAKREIYVYYGKAGPEDKNGPDVLSVQPDDKPPEVKATPVATASGEQPTPPAGGPMMPGGGRGGPPGGPRGGGRPPAGDPSAEKPDGDKNDADKPDGDKTADEKPEDAKPGDSDGDKEAK